MTYHQKQSGINHKHVAHKINNDCKKQQQKTKMENSIESIATEDSMTKIPQKTS